MRAPAVFTIPKRSVYIKSHFWTDVNKTAATFCKKKIRIRRIVITNKASNKVLNTCIQVLIPLPKRNEILKRASRFSFYNSSAKKSLSIFFTSYVCSNETQTLCLIISFVNALPSTKTTFTPRRLLAYCIAPDENLAVVINSPFCACCP